mmetsp:Transcript_14347/g.39108  ORF Transcript_14347/g.39108 Transcript_14347/m.39108 type:complete len:254 (-) Transcript_14347:669-1430(-)
MPPLSASRDEWPWNVVGIAAAWRAKCQGLRSSRGNGLFHGVNLVPQLVEETSSRARALGTAQRLRCLDHRQRHQPTAARAVGDLVILTAADGNGASSMPQLTLAHVANGSGVTSIHNHDDVLGLDAGHNAICEVVVTQVRALIDVPHPVGGAHGFVLTVVLIAILIGHRIAVTRVVEEEGVVWPAGGANLLDGSQHTIPVAMPLEKFRDVGVWDAGTAHEASECVLALSEIVRAPLRVPAVDGRAHQDLNFPA